MLIYNSTMFTMLIFFIFYHSSHIPEQVNEFYFEIFDEVRKRFCFYIFVYNMHHILCMSFPIILHAKWFKHEFTLYHHGSHNCTNILVQAAMSQSVVNNAG